MKTPGGGGYGQISERKSIEEKNNSKLEQLTKTYVERGSVFEYRQSQESV